MRGGASVDDKMTEDKKTTLRWKIDKDVELYRFYLDISVKAVTFLMIVTGAIASYVLKDTSVHMSSISLAFPAIINAGFAVLFFYSIRESKRLFQYHKESCKQLGVPEFNMDPLRAACQIFSMMCAIAALGLLLLIIYTWK
jgi:hypothetical protein